MDTQATLSKHWRRGEGYSDLILRLAEIGEPEMGDGRHCI